MLRCPHKRIITITKVYIARNNIQVELIRFRKNSNFIDIGNFEVGPIVSRLPCLLLCWWRRTFRDMTTSVPYVQAVRTESRRQMSKGRLSTTVTKCMGLLDQCHKNTQLLIFLKFASVDHQEGYISWHQEDGNGSQRSDEESHGEKRTQHHATPRRSTAFLCSGQTGSTNSSRHCGYLRSRSEISASEAIDDMFAKLIVKYLCLPYVIGLYIYYNMYYVLHGYLLHCS